MEESFSQNEYVKPGAPTKVIMVSEPSDVGFNVALAWQGGGRCSREARGSWEEEEGLQRVDHPRLRL